MSMYFLRNFICSLLLGAHFFAGGCSKQEAPDAQAIVDAALAAHGARNLDQGVVTFKLRHIRYRVLRDGEAFLYSRTFTDDTTGRQVRDVLSNSGFQRSMDEVPVALPPDKQGAYTASLNAVVYFALLPYFLNDTAVRREYIGETNIKGEPYHKVRVSFAREGGGEDFEDVFVYWFHQQRHTMDYLAYQYEEDGEKGTRFRQAVNPREVGGVRFQDYINYTSKENFALENYDKAFQAGKLEKVSDISLEEVRVSKLPQM